MRDTISVVVPVYNSGETLPSLVSRRTASLEPAALEFEFNFANDGNRDLSWERIVELSTDDPQVRGVGLTRNDGQHNALHDRPHG